jgi:fibro-slime domain-containing protein
VSEDVPQQQAGTSSGATGGSSTGATGPELVTGGQNSGEGGAEPVSAVCGNAQLEIGEVCDDGNTVDGDGCSADCAEVDLDFDCSTIGEPCERVVICGNGVLEGSEACDDGNTEGADGCAADCSSVDEGFVCVRPGKACLRRAVCGNGLRERGEDCDDGDDPPAGGDGCDELCQLEEGWDCPPMQACVERLCGNGVRTPDEACDDGNSDAGDGCSPTCQVEQGFRCNSNGCLAICGDGLKRADEECDDQNRMSGDGCSAGCRIEPFTTCNQAEPSVCSSSISCGNGIVEPGEICDPPGVNGCKAGCADFVPEIAAPPVCGNELIELDETCDPPNNDQGCSDTCEVQDGWTCPQAGVCFRNPYCGDGIVHAAQGEECDPPSPGNGCTAACKEESGWTCVGLGPSTCVKPVCGNSVVEPGEQCDDGPPGSADDGCHNCTLGSGYVCPEPGQTCIPRCGDGLKRGIEQCDDGNTSSGDGCNAGCKIEPGFACPMPGAPCVAAECGNGEVESGEGCDDGNAIAGDGCGATCQPEPDVDVGPNPVVNVFCGDGLVTGDEECDDGNDQDGDGCDSDCAVETPGFTCSSQLRLPPTIEMQITYRDFKRRSSSGGHPDFQWKIASAFSAPGPVCTSSTSECTAAAGALCPANTCGHLDSEGKPAFHLNPDTNVITNADTFSLWYRDTNPGGIVGQNGAIEIDTIVSSIVLTQQGGPTSETYVYDNTSFWPLTDLGFGNDGNSRNFHFTSELRYFFQYKGGETLTFRGDDDVWVFVNGRHAVDIGGVHGALYGRVVLGDDGDGAAQDSNCSVHRSGSLPACALEAEELASDDDTRFGLVKGNVYEIVLFQAERHTTESNFRLTLAGFLAPRSFCETVCGDGHVVGDEYCDDGAANSDTVSGACNTSCTARNFCGDAIKHSGEFCDNGENTDLYRTAMTPAAACGPGCTALARCGDGVLQAAFEQCDKGSQNDDESYGPTSCKTNCTLGGFCGDGMRNGSEACDLGANNGKTYGPNSCGYDCKPGPFCGDGTRNGGEQCDDGDANGSAGSKCASDCTIKPYCGDGKEQAGEVCDHGQFASDAYGGCTDMCTLGPSCGDGTQDAPYEECDLGTLGNTGAYDGCTNSCELGPRCGDGTLQASDGESCDNGFNDDIYAESQSSCAPGCELPPFCGDGEVQPGFELCDAGSENDDDAYEGCTTSCEFGPYCGDGQIDGDGGELCDDGFDNVSYSADGNGCGYDCQPAPYCGDGARNGPEQCDLGSDENNGAYGACNADCTLAPRCGDGEKQGPEECDDGPTGSMNCTIACKRRSIVE